LAVTVETGTILDRIVAAKREELERTRIRGADSVIQATAAAAPPTLSLEQSLRQAGFGLIAEIKRASPSKGLMAPDLRPLALARTYAGCAASGISVLTETQFFLGSLDEMLSVRHELDDLGNQRPPVLRKDFIFDPYQVSEARMYGADALLLIVAILEEPLLRDLHQQTTALGMDALVEVHDEGEMEVALRGGATLLGVNNRDLRNFHTTLETTERLAHLAPPEAVLVSESGINRAADIERVRRAGASAVLIGESIVTSPDPAAHIRSLYPWKRVAA
jgi:indole-3-glycerol phosphate synthase